MEKSERLPVIYIPHGGGPWHVMMDDFGPDSGYEGLAVFSLLSLFATLGKKICLTDRSVGCSLVYKFALHRASWNFMQSG